MIALGTFTFAFLLYFIRLALTILIFIYLKITSEKCKGKQIFNKIKKGLFFNNILGMAIEGMIEFLINGYLNAMTPEISSFGEVMGISLSGFCIFTNLLFLPVSILFFALKKNEKLLENKQFQQKYSILFEGIKTGSKL